MTKEKTQSQPNKSPSLAEISTSPVLHYEFLTSLGLVTELSNLHVCVLEFLVLWDAASCHDLYK